MCAPDHSPRRGQGGFTLVELLVSLVISLLVALAALGSAHLFMAGQRQGVAAGTASANAVTAMASLKHEIEQAGLGFYANGTFPCQSFNMSSGNIAVAINAALLPVRITSTGAAAQLDLIYADSLQATAPALLTSPTSSDSANAALASFMPVSVGQTVMFTPLGDTGLPCTVRSVTGVAPPAPGAGPVLHFETAGVHNQVAFAPVTYSTSSAISMLGTLNWIRFALDGNSNLVMSHPTQGTSAIIARNVVGFQAQYGVSDGVTSGLNSWQYAEGSDWSALSTANLGRVRALRVGLVLRSNLAEKADPVHGCTATQTQPELLDRALNLSGDWQCYRYRSSTVVVPLRNILMGSPS